MNPLTILILFEAGVLTVALGLAGLGILSYRRHERRLHQIRDESHAALLRWAAAMRAAHDPQEPEGSEIPR